ncbi:putative transmembrane protein [Gregarina niphandrodes]|uniref:Transmembrane protein n=1 Tax=Gregarina niphandrodes TaxID=110365 RepID=A0A023B563_GRENI|nr:putative transmembrane protein [Gregarina niphandrodes]EZG58753.1 putative transmembrane protein [Gregarina niphandrodes]|eukprot:XP_011130943.1 putative transmembrane protein [Gregarina niphandrodes]
MKLAGIYREGDGRTDDEVSLYEESTWLEACSRILLHRPRRGVINAAELTALREIVEHLEDVDPENKFAPMSNLICQKSVGRTMSELLKMLEDADGCDDESGYEPLEVVDYRPLTSVECTSLRGTVSREWLSVLPESSHEDVEAGLGWGATRCHLTRCRLALAAGTLLTVGLGLACLMLRGIGHSKVLEVRDSPRTSPRTQPPTTTERPGPFKVKMSRRALAWTMNSNETECREAFNSVSYRDGSWPVLTLEVGSYPCGGGSGQLLCAAGDALTDDIGGTCHHFGGPAYDVFEVKDAIRRILHTNENCVVRCDDEEAKVRNMWQEVQKLAKIPIYPNSGFLYFTQTPAVPNMADFQMMLQPRYPVEKSCSGSCVDCNNMFTGPEENRVPSCYCNLVNITCLVRPETEQVAQWIDHIGLYTTLQQAFEGMSPFNTEDEIFDVRECVYKCHHPVPELRNKDYILERELAGPDDPLIWRLSRLELRKLQLFLEQCHNHSGTLQSGWISLQWKMRYDIISTELMGVKCDPKRTVALDLSRQAKTRLWKESDIEQKNELARMDFLNALMTEYPADKECSSICYPDQGNCNIPNCLCRVAHAECAIRVEGDKIEHLIESYGFDARLPDVFGVLSVPGANAKEGHNKTKHIQTKMCYAGCHGIVSPKPVSELPSSTTEEQHP